MKKKGLKNKEKKTSVFKYRKNPTKWMFSCHSSSVLLFPSLDIPGGGGGGGGPDFPPGGGGGGGGPKKGRWEKKKKRNLVIIIHYYYYYKYSFIIK